jgi:hypothetical protein
MTKRITVDSARGMTDAQLDHAYSVADDRSKAIIQGERWARYLRSLDDVTRDDPRPRS